MRDDGDTASEITLSSWCSATTGFQSKVFLVAGEHRCRASMWLRFWKYSRRSIYETRHPLHVKHSDLKIKNVLWRDSSLPEPLQYCDIVGENECWSVDEAWHKHIHSPFFHSSHQIPRTSRNPIQHIWVSCNIATQPQVQKHGLHCTDHTEHNNCSTVTVWTEAWATDRL